MGRTYPVASHADGAFKTHSVCLPSRRYTGKLDEESRLKHQVGVVMGVTVESWDSQATRVSRSLVLHLTA